MVTENLDINSKHWWVQLTKNHRITFRGLVQKSTFGKCMGLAWKYLHRSALPHQRPTREPLKFRVANLAYHHSATQECGPPGRRHATAARARRGTTRKGPVPRPPRPPGRPPAVPGRPRLRGPAARTDRRLSAAGASAEAWRRPSSPTHLGGARGQGDSPGRAPQGSRPGRPRRPGFPGWPYG